ncbi:MAG: phosphoglycerate dehydrogenase [Anaerolineae bacterium]
MTDTPLESAKVLVTATSFGRGAPRLREELAAAVGQVVYNTAGRPLSSAELAALLPGCDGMIAGLDEIDGAALAHADRLRVIARYGAGVDNVDLEAARARGIVVTNTPGANAAAVAELAVGLMLCLARGIVTACEQTRAGSWPRLPGLSLEGKTVGLLGLGAVGKQVARRLAGFDCRLLAHDPAADEAFARANSVTLCGRDEVIAGSDFLSLHLPLLPATRHMVDAAFLARMRVGAFLINTARGELVDDEALLRALESGHLRGAALDAFSTEPPPAGHPLLAHPRVLATPHMGAHADSAMQAMGDTALRECLAVLRGEEPLHRVV